MKAVIRLKLNGLYSFNIFVKKNDFYNYWVYMKLLIERSWLEVMIPLIKEISNLYIKV